jgi:hypothetical protein
LRAASWRKRLHGRYRWGCGSDASRSRLAAQLGAVTGITLLSIIVKVVTLDTDWDAAAS